MMIMDS